jgi:hypothetical protein
MFVLLVSLGFTFSFLLFIILILIVFLTEHFVVFVSLNLLIYLFLSCLLFAATAGELSLTFFDLSFSEFFICLTFLLFLYFVLPDSLFSICVPL